MQACYKGQLRFLEWLVKKYDYKLKDYEMNSGFINSCMEGFLDISKWLIKNYPNIDVHSGDEYGNAFVWSCAGGHLETAQ